MLYVETSALLRWLLGQPQAESIRRILQDADRVASSCLTVLECQRAFARLVGEISPKEHALLRATLLEAARHWLLVEMDAPVRARASEPFPSDPLRTLDAIHLATCLDLDRDFGPITVMTTDTRVRQNAERLGLRVVPELA